MKLRLQSNQIENYLRRTDVVDCDDPGIVRLAERLKNKTASETDLLRRTYEFVRDEIDHSADIQGKVVTCKASEVLAAKEGICFAKSHLLAALLRANGIPSGFCYQRLRLDATADSPFVLHGLNGIFVKETGYWVRLDVRGNKNGIDARFSVTEEHLAFPIRPEQGEIDYPIIYPDPVDVVIDALTRWKTFEKLWANLPNTIEPE